ncbi:MAG: outer membrane beta-barrel protein [Sideroxydans sp.]|nr:outer membrane beta-barrel protein [Sideroxydans sp.]
MDISRPQAISGVLCLLAAGAAQSVLADPGAGWNGCYAGVNGGYGSAHISGLDATNTTIGSATADGGVVGGQAGCDRQSASWVVGAQLSASKAFLSGSHLYVAGSGPSDRVTYNIDYLVTLTGRVGYAFQPETLAYLKAGGAMTRTGHNDSDPAPLVGVAYTGNKAVMRNGWMVGAGLERKIGSNLSGYVEYNYMDFGKQTVTIAYSDGIISSYSFKQQMNYLGLGVNYRF